MNLLPGFNLVSKPIEKWIQQYCVDWDELIVRLTPHGDIVLVNKRANMAYVLHEGKTDASATRDNTASAEINETDGVI